MNFAFHPEAEVEFSRAIEYYEDIAPGLGYDFIYQAVMWAHIAKNCRQSREIGKTEKLTGILK